MATKETRKDLPSAKKGATDVTDLHGLRKKVPRCEPSSRLRQLSSRFRKNEFQLSFIWQLIDEMFLSPCLSRLMRGVAV